LFKALFDIFEADKVDRLHETEVVAMMAIMGIVVADYATIIARVDVVIDVSQVVAGYRLGKLINPLADRSRSRAVGVGRGGRVVSATESD